MPKKYHFRKMHFICFHNRVINACLSFVHAYQDRETAEEVVESRKDDRTTRYIWEKPDMPINNEKVESFYLVHESLYEKLLKEHDIDAK